MERVISSGSFSCQADAVAWVSTAHGSVGELRPFGPTKVHWKLRPKDPDLHMADLSSDDEDSGAEQRSVKRARTVGAAASIAIPDQLRCAHDNEAVVACAQQRSGFRISTPLVSRFSQPLPSAGHTRGCSKGARGGESSADEDGNGDPTWVPSADDTEVASPPRARSVERPVSSGSGGGGGGDGGGGGCQSGVAARAKIGGSSKFRGVTRHSTTGRYEAHLWDAAAPRPKAQKGKRTRGKQIYLGGYEEEVTAARSYDRAAIKYFGPREAALNFPLADYEAELPALEAATREEVVALLKRGSSGFSRGRSKFRGVTRHHQQGRWEARIGRVADNRYKYLGTFPTELTAARAYDLAAIMHRGSKAAVTNFSLSDYAGLMADPATLEERVQAALAELAIGVDTTQPASGMSAANRGSPKTQQVVTPQSRPPSPVRITSLPTSTPVSQPALMAEPTTPVGPSPLSAAMLATAALLETPVIGPQSPLVCTTMLLPALPAVSSPALLQPASAATSAYTAWEHQEGDEQLAAILLDPPHVPPPTTQQAWSPAGTILPEQPPLSRGWWSDGCLSFVL